MGNARAEEAEPGEFLWELQVWGAGVEMDIYYLKMPVIPILMDAQTFTKSSEIETSSLGYLWSWNLKICVLWQRKKQGYIRVHTLNGLRKYFLKMGTLRQERNPVNREAEFKVPMWGLAQGKEGRSQLASEGQLEQLRVNKDGEGTRQARCQSQRPHPAQPSLAASAKTAPALTV